MTIPKKFLLKNFNKFIAVVFIVIMMVSAFGVLSFADNTIMTTRRSTVITTTRVNTSADNSTTTVIKSVNKDSAQPTYSTSDEISGEFSVNVKIVSSVDENEGTSYISNSNIKIYKVSSKNALKKSNARANNLYAVAKTGTKGEVDVRLSPGYYIIIEDDFTYNDIKYTAEPMYIEIKNGITDASYYLKHSVVQSRTPIPFTGSTSSAVISCAVAMAIAGATVLLTFKKKESAS